MKIELKLFPGPQELDPAYRPMEAVHNLDMRVNKSCSTVTLCDL